MKAAVLDSETAARFSTAAALDTRRRAFPPLSLPWHAHRAVFRPSAVCMGCPYLCFSSFAKTSCTGAACALHAMCNLHSICTAGDLSHLGAIRQYP